MYKIISPPPPPPPKKKPFDDYPRVSTLIDRDMRRWKVNVVKSLFLPFEVRTILNIPLNHNLPEDQIIRVGNKKGEFTVKSAYYIAVGVLDTMDESESSSGDPRSPLWKKLWHLNILSKMRIFAWKMCMNALPTLMNLQRRGINLCEIYPTCGKKPESILYALVRCEVAKRV